MSFTSLNKRMNFQMEEMAPLVYTPTVGTVCEQFGLNFSRGRGMYFSVQDRGKFGTMVYNWPHDGMVPFFHSLILLCSKYRVESTRCPCHCGH